MKNAGRKSIVLLVLTLSAAALTACAGLAVAPDTDEIVARLPNPGGMHDHVVVPESWEGLKSSRSTSV